MIRKPKRYLGRCFADLWSMVVQGFVSVFSLLNFNTFLLAELTIILDDFFIIDSFNQTVKNGFFLYSENAQTTHTVVPNDATTSEDV